MLCVPFVKFTASVLGAPFTTPAVLGARFKVLVRGRDISSGESFFGEFFMLNLPNFLLVTTD